MFETGYQALVYLRSPGVYNSDPCRIEFFPASVLENIIHFWRKGLIQDSPLMMIYYNVGDENPSQHPGWTKEMSPIPRLQRKKVLYQVEGTQRALTRTLWRPEHRNVLWMKGPVWKLSRRGDVEMDLCAVTDSEAKACMLLD